LSRKGKKPVTLYRIRKKNKLTKRLYTLKQAKDFLKGHGFADDDEWGYEVAIKKAVVYDMIEIGHVVYFEDVGNSQKYMW
jgi:hypothetical protein